MNYSEYCESIKDINVSDKLEFRQAIMWLHPEILPLGLVSMGELDAPVIKVPERAKNKYDRVVPVIAISKDAFAGKKNITDIILPSSIESIPQGAFAGCTNLKNITIPKKIRVIKEGTFKDCKKIENVFYEGTAEEWDKIEIVHEKHEIDFGECLPGTPVQTIISERRLFIPGNEPLLTCNIHFNCDLKKSVNSSFNIRTRREDITDLFRIRI